MMICVVLREAAARVPTSADGPPLPRRRILTTSPSRRGSHEQLAGAARQKSQKPAPHLPAHSEAAVQVLTARLESETIYVSVGVSRGMGANVP